jgi:adenylate cyclase
MRLCEAAFGVMFIVDADHLHIVAERDVPRALADYLGEEPPQAGPDTLLGQAIGARKILHSPNALEAEPYRRGVPLAVKTAELGGVRALLMAPLVKDEAVLGVFAIFRQEPRPFSDKQIALLQNFAAQAVIAMENARLLTETREALDQQTATAEVLQVINASPGDLAPVFEAMLERAMRLCEAAFGMLWTYDGTRYHAPAVHGAPPAFVEFVRQPQLPPYHPGSGLGRMLQGEDLVVHEDMAAEEAYRVGDPLRRAIVDLGGAHTAVTVSLRKEQSFLGAFTVYRQEVRPFTDKQIALLQNFAAQAVIAMENARLITETRQRTAELQESLEYQTATSDVLKIISRSPVDLGGVFDFVCETAARLCGVQSASIFRRDGGVYRWATGFGLPPAYRAIEEANTIAPGRGTLVGRVALGGKTVHILDALNDPEYEAKEELRVSEHNTLLGVPLLRDGVVLGVICLARRGRIEAFTDQQIELVTTFADQAVIAIENMRLFDELRARTDEIAGWNRELEVRVAAQVDELGRVEHLKRFLPPQLAEMVVSQGDESILKSHRREIVVVFCDVRGYTAFAETAEPEEVIDFLGEYHAALGPLITRFEGTLSHFFGDGLMVFFNDPLPCPDPAERAVRMALAIREAAGDLIAGWRRRGHRIGFGAGIAQGYATLGQIGFADRSDYTAIGTVCNLAARLCGEAQDGQILVARRIAAAVEDSVVLEELGPLELKGLTQPVVAFNVVKDAGMTAAVSD